MTTLHWRGQRSQIAGTIFQAGCDACLSFLDCPNAILSLETKQCGLTGARDWARYEVVLDVPFASTSLFYGALLAGHGQLWVMQIQLEPVGRDVPVSNDAALDRPANLDFSA